MVMPQADLALPSARDDFLAPSVLVTRGRSRARAGEVGLAVTDLEQAREDAARLGDLDRSCLLAALVDCRLARGELAAALEHREQLRSEAEAPGAAGAVAHLALGELAAALGDVDTASEHQHHAGRLVLEVADDPDLVPWRTEAALSAVRLGQRSVAVDLALEHLARARAAGSPYAVGLGLRTLAFVDVRVDQERTLLEARAAIATTPAARLAAQLDADLAGVLLLSGRTDRSVEVLALLRAAEAYAGREQLAPLQARVRRLLERLGEPARPILAEALAALTAAEARVATLAAGGMTNREIAGQLVVTVKAVEWHLSRVYRKLGIRSRSSLASSLGLA